MDEALFGKNDCARPLDAAEWKDFSSNVTCESDGEARMGRYKAVNVNIL